VSKYEPQPIDTSHVELDSEIRELTEQLAKNAHDVWALERMEHGWRFGKKRNDRKKTHPSLVPYEELPPEEKEYDRKTAIQTLKALLAMDYHIEKKPSGNRDANTDKGKQVREQGDEFGATGC